MASLVSPPVVCLAALALGLGWLWWLVERPGRTFWRRIEGALCAFALLAAGSAGREWALDAARQPSTINHPVVNRRLLTADNAQLAIYRQPLNDRPFMASTIKDIYHRSTCRYARQMTHARHYATQDEARADGKEPCKHCLPVIEE